MDVHPRAECYVDCGVEVCGEEDDTFEVFEFAEEDWVCVRWGLCFGGSEDWGTGRLTGYQFVPCDIAGIPLGHEHIGFCILLVSLQGVSKHQ